MKKILGILILINFVLIHNYAQTNYTEKFYQNFITGNMDTWQVNLNQLKNDYKESKSQDKLEKIVKAQYGLIAYFIGIEEKKKAALELELAHQNIDLLIKQLPNDKQLLAWKGAFYGFGMGITPWKLFYFGPQSQELITEAIQNAKEFPESNFEFANMLFWAPSIVGGNKEESLVYYKKTIRILEAKNETRDWYYLWTLTAYANAVKEVKGMGTASEVYNKILKVEPDYKWIKQEIMKNPDAFPKFNL